MLGKKNEIKIKLDNQYNENKINKFNNDDEILCDLMKLNEDDIKLSKKLSLLEISTLYLDEFEIESYEDDDIKVIFSNPELEEQYIIEKDQTSFKLHTIDNLKKKKDSYGNIKVLVGSYLEIDKINLILTNQVNNLSKFKIIASALEIQTVKGLLKSNQINVSSFSLNNISCELFIESLTSITVNINNISGKLSINSLNTDTLDIVNLFGEINICGNVDSYLMDINSGTVNMNGKNISSTNGLRFRNNKKYN